MSILRTLKQPKKTIDSMTMKQLVFYLTAFLLMSVFLIGFLLGTLV